MDDFKWLPHAKKRAEERFPGVDLGLALASAKRPTKKQRQRIKTHCPVSARRYMTGQWAGRYCVITREDICFVIQSPDKIVTVFQLEKSPTKTSNIESGSNKAMNESRFKSLMQGQTSQARKVFEALQQGTSLHINTVIATLTDKGTPLARNAVEGALRQLVDAGLAKEQGQDCFIPVEVKAKTKPTLTGEPIPGVDIPAQPQSEQTDLPDEAFPSPVEHVPFTAIPAFPPKSILDQMADFAQDMRAMAERAETIALQIEEVLSGKDAELEQFAQFKKLLKTMGLAA